MHIHSSHTHAEMMEKNQAQTNRQVAPHKARFQYQNTYCDNSQIYETSHTQSPKTHQPQGLRFQDESH